MKKKYLYIILFVIGLVFLDQISKLLVVNYLSSEVVLIKNFLSFGPLGTLLVSIIGMLYPIITNNMLKVWIPDGNTRFIVIFGSLLMVLYILRMLLRFFIQYYGHVIGVKMQAAMRNDLFNKLQKLPYSYYDNHETGKIMSRMTNDLMDVSELAHHGPENIFICGIMVIGSFIFLMFINS